MHAVAGVPVLCSSCEKGKERKSKDLLLQGRERERGKAAKDKQRKQFDSPTAASFACIGAKHVAQSKQIAREKQIASSKQSTKHDVVRRTLSKQSTKYVDGRTKNEAARHHRSTTAKQSTYSTTPKQSTTSSQLGGETPSSAALHGSGSHLCVFFLPRTPPRSFVSTSHPEAAWLCARRPSYAAGPGRGAP